jgi:hypothetical protein
MKPTATAETEGTGGPALSVVAEPTEAQILKGRIEALEKQNTELASSEAALKSKNAKLSEELTAAGCKIRELERNPLTFALSSLDAGAVLEEAGAQLRALVTSVMNRQLKGKFTLGLTIKPFKAGSLVFVPEVKIAEPKPEPAKSIFYANSDGDLSRNDPKQKEFGFSRGDRSGNADPDAYADEERDPMLR